MKINEALLLERRRLNLTQRNMVKDTGISVSHYSKWEHGMQIPSATDLFELLVARKISIESFYSKLEYGGDEQTLDEKIEREYYQQSSKSEKKAHQLSISDQKWVKELFLSSGTWVEDISLLQRFANTIAWVKIPIGLCLMDSLYQKYYHIDQFPIREQKKIAIILANFLYLLTQDQSLELGIKYVNLLRSLSKLPELAIYLELGDYYLLLLNGNLLESTKLADKLDRLVPNFTKRPLIC
ncbi:helix-turn-helix domain-containing protein [Lactobacillus sp.]|uniref:helix-turn-helix domain-containing protein n=1 Tax=Lactobacillus sp. TaxID=1591 RepID=UPI003EF5A974